MNALTTFKAQRMNRKTMLFVLSSLFLLTFLPDLALGQTKAGNRILIDVAHGQRFWKDPADMAGMDASYIERVKYMTGEITKSANAVKADIGYVKGQINPADLRACDLLFIHLPSAQYQPDEVNAIKEYVQKGGALLLVMDVDYWSTLKQTNVNDLVAFSDIKFGPDSPDTLSGGYTKPGQITDKKLKVTYHGARIVTGGTPFAYDNQAETYPFATFTKVKNGGKIVAMGDGMVSLYMTEWKDVKDYQCQEFMQAVFSWLLR
jgi:hypothetical protein